MQKHQVAGAVLLFSSYFLLVIGLFGWLIEYKHTVKYDPAWFKGYPDEDKFKQLGGFIGEEPITVLPRTVRSLFGKGIQEKQTAATSDEKKPSSSMMQLFGRRHGPFSKRKFGAKPKAMQDVVHPQADDSNGGGILAVGGSFASDTEEECDGLFMWLVGEYRAGRAGLFAPAALLCFGLGVPLLKLMAAVVYLSTSGPVKHKCSFLASGMARWTAVDAVAEAMVVALLIQSGVSAKHQLGYAAFIGYVFLSGIGAWLLFDEHTDLYCDFLPGHKRLALSCLPVTLCCFLGFAVMGTFAFPVGSLWVEESAISSEAKEMMKQKGYMGMAEMFLGKSLLDKIFVEFGQGFPKPHAETTLIEAVKTLLLSGHMYTIAGSLALFVGVLAMPMLQVLLATWLAYSACDVAAAGRRSTTSRKLRNVLGLVQELAMLDVFVLGVAVGHGVAGSVSGVKTELGRGFLCLIVAVAAGFSHVQLCFVAASESGGNENEGPEAFEAEGEKGGEKGEMLRAGQL